MLIYQGINKVYTHEHAEKLKNLILNDDDEANTNTSHSSFSYKFEKYLIQTGLSDFLDIINCSLTLIIIIFYIISTYTISDDEDLDVEMNIKIDSIEVFLCVFLIAHFGLKVYISPNRLMFLFTFDSLIDVGTIVPIFLAKQKFVSNEFKYFLRLFRMIRFLYFYKIENILQRRTNETVRYSFKLIINVLAIIFLSTSIILELENNKFRGDLKDGSFDLNWHKRDYTQYITSKTQLLKAYQFHDMLYYMLVTLGTIGYGDIIPRTTLGRFTIIITILFVLLIIPTLSQKLITILALTSKYSRISYRKYSRETKHLILLGSCGVEGFEAFLEELYHEDHGNVDYQTVIMQSFPNEQIMVLIRQSNLFNKIFYLVGNSLIHKDLHRCKADSAVCVVLLANKLAKNPKFEDFSNILQAFSVKKFAQIYLGQDIRICIQLLRPETKEIYFSSLLNRDQLNSKDQVICVEEIKLQLLGKSCLCPGINTIVSSLITSNKPSLTEGEVLSPDRQWLNEYLEGMQNEIYRIKMDSDVIQGIKFIELVKIIYEVSGLTLIGVDVIFDQIDPFVCLNPHNYIFSPFDHVIYVLADKLPDSTSINTAIRDRLLRSNEERENNYEMAKLIKLRNPTLDQTSRNQENTQKSYKNKNKDQVVQNKINFIQTTFPRTQHEAENFSNEILNNHIIVCGLIQNMKNLIMPLRAVSMKNQQFPILIMDKEDHIGTEIWKDIQYFPEIYFMQGNPIKSKDLHKACIKKAKAVIILSKNNFEVDSQEMIDADTIFIYKAIRNENKNVLIIADLASISTIAYISSNDEIPYKKQGYRLSEQFAVGEIYTGSMLDTLMCQSFFNPYITNILQQLILGSAAFTYSPDLIRKLQERKVIQSTLYLLNIYEELDKMGIKNLPNKIKYEVIFKYFIDRNMVPIGIYRNSKQSLTSNLKNLKNDKYVYLCPDRNTDIFIKNDKIYVLESEDENTENKLNYKSKEVSNLNNKNLKLIEKSNDLVTKLMINVKDLLAFNHECLKTSFSVKKVVDVTRMALRKEFAGIHDQIVEEDEKNQQQIEEKRNIRNNYVK